MENAQVAEHLSYATAAGYSLIDAELYLPTVWTGDPKRLAGACVPDDVAFATKPERAEQMITRAFDAGVPAAWVAGHEVYGNATGLRRTLAEHWIGYEPAVAWQPPGRQRCRADARGPDR